MLCLHFQVAFMPSISYTIYGPGTFLFSVQLTDVVYAVHCLCLGVRWPLLILNLILFISVLTKLRRVLTGFMYVLNWWSCASIVWLCLSSDPQSSRARKLCVTMEPALLLKGDILVGNFPYTLHHCNTSIIY